MIDINNLRYINNLKHGIDLYYSVLMYDRHEILSIGAACKIIDHGLINNQNFERLVELSRYKGVRDRLLPVLYDSYTQDKVQAILNQGRHPEKLSLDDLIRAKTERDAVKTIDCYRELFKYTGDFKQIEAAVQAVTKVSSMELAIEVLVVNILLSPENGLWALSLFDLLVVRGAVECLAKFRGILEDASEYEALQSIIKIELALLDEAYDVAEKNLEKFSAFELPDILKYQINKFYARIFENQARYHDACKYYDKVNLWIRSSSYKDGAYLEYVNKLNALKFRPVPPGKKECNHLIMLGFPRSGTTLLENILDSHSQVSTVEEIGAFAESDKLLFQYLANHPDTEALPSQLVLRMKVAYYKAINDSIQGAPGKYIIDKMPIMSSRATYLKNLFSNKRYIFSIRHPYDVVLSCYKQAFGTNLAMDCFTSFEESCSTYDSVMKSWFLNFDINSKEVCYVRYDDLCINFDEEVARILNFIGVNWDPAVRNFAEKAKMRSQRTPSYHKVKLGNTIGVQSSWKNYKFLFEKPEARVLDKWVTFFGYRGL